MADLYVSTTGSDSNSGTAGSPFKTILKASQAAGAGTTVHVASGTYSGGFQTNASGTADAPIRYVSDVKWGAKIVPPSSGGDYEAWDNRGSNVVIDGFEIDGSVAGGGKPWLFGLYTAGSNSVVQNMKVHDIATTSAAMSVANTGQGGAGIMADGWAGGTNMKVIGNEVYDIGPAGQSSSLVHGVYMSTTGEVKNNLIHQVVGDGITTWHDATNLTIMNNTVFQANGAGIMIGGGGQYHGTPSHDYTKVANNIIYDNAKGIEEYGTLGTHNTYSNNLVYGNDSNLLMKNGKAASTISADPKFMNYDSDGGGNYHLSAGSPAVNAGTSSGAPTVDLDGNARQGAVDVGAYEYGSTSATTPPVTTTPVSTSGAAKIVVNAHGVAAGGKNAHFNLLVDGKKIGEATVGTSAKDFAFTADVSADQAHKVQIQYDNDAVVKGQDRTLIVDKVTINGSSVAPTASTVTYDKGALDGKDVAAGQTHMWWNGTLVVNANKSLFAGTAAAKAASLSVESGDLDVYQHVVTQGTDSASSFTDPVALADHAAGAADLHGLAAMHWVDPLHLDAA
ncbi:carbohydrate-binding domain-containing protein [Azospirillum doebereinerae]|uniref:carbohydrate-binding domain-containing protein n=1 Tax=Azospirillum doebereinerae TaxID=92933 RepID=UPI0030842758